MDKLFLLIYDRKRQAIVSLREWDVSDRDIAEKTRLDAQMKVIEEGTDHEVVFLQSDSLETIKATHGSYFFTFQELADRFMEMTKWTTKG